MIKAIKPPGIILIFILFFVLRDSFAQDKTGLDAQRDAAIEEELALSSSEGLGYRQQLGKVIAEKEEELPQEADAYLRYLGSSRAGSQPGRVGIIDSAIEYSYEIKAWDKLPVQLAVASRYIGIENTTAVFLPAHLTSAGFGLETTLPFFNFDKTYFTVGLAPSFFSDNWHFRASSFSLMQRYFLIYQPDEKLVFVCGVDYSPRFNDPVEPILGFIYKPNDRLTFSIIPDTPEIAYSLNDKLSVFIQGSSTNNEYRIAKDNLKNAVLEYNEMHLGAGLRCKWNRQVTGAFTFGGVFNRSLRYRDKSLGKVTLEDGFYTEFRLVMAV